MLATECFPKLDAAEKAALEVKHTAATCVICSAASGAEHCMGRDKSCAVELGYWYGGKGNPYCSGDQWKGNKDVCLVAPGLDASKIKAILMANKVDGCDKAKCATAACAGCDAAVALLATAAGHKKRAGVVANSVCLSQAPKEGGKAAMEEEDMELTGV